jgi:type II secretory pathway pseudopilin PulG
MAAIRQPRRQEQAGFALIVLLALITAGVLYFLVGQLNANAVRQRRDEVTAKALAQAKDALIGYATTYPEQHLRGTPHRAAFVPGHLPCPDASSALGNEGDEDANCGAKGVTVVGYLPWKTLGLPPLKDGWGNCLWYAVSGTFKANPKADLLNWDSLGQYKIVAADGTTVLAGATPDSQVVAIVFSPGPPLAGQNRTGGVGECGGDYDPSHFLDRFTVGGVGVIDNAAPSGIADAVSTAAAEGPSGQFNDRLLAISRDDIITHGFERRTDLSAALNTLVNKTASCLATYGSAIPPNPATGISDLRLPWAAPVVLADDAPNTFLNDKFADAAKQLVGRIPFQVSRSFAVTGSTLGALSACSASGDPHCRLFRTDNCPDLLPVAGYPTPADGPVYQDSPDGWLEKWKDQLYYAVAEDFQPTSTTALPELCDQPTVSGRKCIYVDGKGPFAAVVLLANTPLPGQTRTTLADVNNPANYLDGQNAIAIATNDPSNDQFGQFTKAHVNDILVCIRKDLVLDPTCTNP